jgi:hypothetical protein
LDDLIKIRPKTHNEPRPIIFITGDLGGLIVKKALIKSNSVAVSYSETTRQTESIIVSTVRVVFLRSPTKEDTLNSSHLKSLSDRLVKLQQEEFNRLSEHFLVYTSPSY